MEASRHLHTATRMLVGVIVAELVVTGIAGLAAVVLVTPPVLVLAGLVGAAGAALSEHAPFRQLRAPMTALVCAMLGMRAVFGVAQFAGVALTPVVPVFVGLACAALGWRYRPHLRIELRGHRRAAA